MERVIAMQTVSEQTSICSRYVTTLLLSSVYATTPNINQTPAFLFQSLSLSLFLILFIPYNFFLFLYFSIFIHFVRFYCRSMEPHSEETNRKKNSCISSYICIRNKYPEYLFETMHSALPDFYVLSYNCNMLMRLKDWMRKKRETSEHSTTRH